MRTVAALSLAGVLCLAPLASASPSAAPESGSATKFQLSTRSGVYTVALLASTPTGGSPRLRVLLTPPSGSNVRLIGTLPASASTATTVQTRLGSVPLRVVFHPESADAAVSLGETDSDTSTAEGWMIAGNGGTADIALGSVRCTVDLMVTGTAVGFDTNGYGAPLAKGLGLSLKGARCGSLPSNPLPPPIP